MGVGGCEMKTIGYTCRSVVLKVFGPGFNSRRLHQTSLARPRAFNVRGDHSLSSLPFRPNWLPAAPPTNFFSHRPCCSRDCAVSRKARRRIGETFNKKRLLLGSSPWISPCPFRYPAQRQGVGGTRSQEETEIVDETGTN